MKRINVKVWTTLLLFLSGITGNQAIAQTIRIANNNPGATPGTNVHTGETAFQDAIDASVSGDIIHVVPSSVDYGDGIVTNKSLTILGIGLNSQKHIGQRSMVGDISLNETGSSGTRISGLHMTRLLLANSSASPTYTVSNVLLENCQVRTVIGPSFSNTVANLIVRNCIFNSSNVTSDPQAFELLTTSGVIITNNIIQGGCCVNGAIAGDGLVVENNLFYYNNTGFVFQGVHNSTIRNNIFYGTSPSLDGFANNGNVTSHNLVFSTGDTNFTDGTDGNTDGGGNISGDPLLANLPTGSGDWNYSYDITLQTGSPALLTGSDGTDIGPSGGATPFDPEGTFLPLVQEINMPSIVTKGTDLEVNIKAKGN